MSEKLQAIELEKSYNPKEFEERIYSFWEANKCFSPIKKKNTKNTFTAYLTSLHLLSSFLRPMLRAFSM